MASSPTSYLPASKALIRTRLAGALIGGMAGGSFIAALIHIAVAGDHFEAHMPSGSFFYGLAAFQWLWGGLVLLKASRRVLLLGALVNALVIGIWLVSRTVGLPVGPDSGLVESAGPADSLATGLEALLVFAALTLRPRLPDRAWLPPGWAAAVAVTFFVGLMPMTQGALASGEYGHEGAIDRTDHPEAPLLRRDSH